MIRQHTHQRGVTLFEMLLVLMVMAVVIVSVIQYAQTLREETGAERYGKKLYEYGQAVREYVFDKSAEVRAGDPIPGVTWDGSFDSFTAVGVDWLKPTMAGLNSDGQPYLREDFTFNTGVEPLIVRRVTSDQNPETFDGDEAFTTTVGFEDPTQKNFSALTIKIIAGLLYGDEEGTEVVMPDLSLDAARYATDRYSTSLGVAAFEYDIAADFSKPDEYNPEAEPITGVLSSLGEEDDFLRTDGLNYMKKALAFGDDDDKADLNLPGAVGDMDIVGVENIYFDDDADAGELNTLENLHELNFDAASSESKIQNLKTLSFQKGGEIKDVQNIYLSGNNPGVLSARTRIIFPGPVSVADTPDGAIENVRTIAFQTGVNAEHLSRIKEVSMIEMNDNIQSWITGVHGITMRDNTASNITGVREITFQNNMRMRGLYRSPNCVLGDSLGQATLVKQFDNGALISFCTITMDKDAANCQVRTSTDGQYWVGWREDGDKGKCAFRCFYLHPNAYASSKWCKFIKNSSTVF